MFTFDFLELHDGVDETKSTIIKFGGGDTADPTPYVSTGSALFIRFYTDGISQDLGFELQWTIPGRYIRAGHCEIVVVRTTTSGDRQSVCC